MKVIHVLNNYLPKHIAGTEVYVSSLARHLKPLGVASIILLPNYGETINEHFSFEDTQVIKFAEPSEVNRDLITGKTLPKGLPYFIDIIRNENPDIVHFHELAGSNGIGLSHAEAVHDAGFKSIMTFHIAKYTCRTGTLMYMNESLCDGVIRKIRCSRCWLNNRGEHRGAAALMTAGFMMTNLLHMDTRGLNNSLGTVLAFPAIIAQSKKDLHRLAASTNRFIALTDWYNNILIRNDIDASHIEIIEQGIPNETATTIKHSSVEDGLRLFFIGRISPFKGILQLINAVNKLSGNIMLHIYGTSNDEDYMSNCIKASETNPAIKWKGSLSPTDVIETMKQYDIVCIPSAVSEMGPFVLKEAFAAGIPVLASNVYGNREQITDGINGWLFKFKNETDLVMKLQDLVNNPSKVKQAASNIKPPRSFAAVAVEHQSLYRQILGN